MKWKSTALGEVMRHRKGSITIDDTTSYKLCRVQLHRRGVVLRQNLTGAAISTKKQQVCKAGDFLVAEMDAKVGGYGFVPPELDGAIVSSHYYLFEVDAKKLHPEYLEVVSQAEILQQQIVAKGSTNYSSIRPGSVLEWKIPLPLDIEVQKQIARNFKAVQSKLSVVGAEITHQQSLLAKLKQAILQEAIQGKLTADWRAAHPDVEPASQLLDRIQAEKARLIAAKKLRPEKPLPKITPAEIPFESPNGWEWCPLAAVMILRDGERNPISKAERERRGKGFPYYGASGAIDEIDGYTHDGDFLLVGEDGSNLRLRSTPIAFGASGKIWVNNHAHVLEFIEPVLQEFIAHRLNGMDIAPFVTGGFQPKLSQENMNRIPIPLPPLAEQAAIVERVEALMTICRALEAEIDHARTHAAHLLQAVLKEAFDPASA